MIQLALIPLALAAFLLFRRYGMTSVMHPGVWFSLAWILAIGCYTLTDWFNGVPVHNPDQMNELLMFLVLTSAAFVLCARLFPAGRRLQRATFLEVNSRLLVIAGGTGFVAALVNWYILTGGSLYSEEVRQQWLVEIPVVTARLWWLYLATYPAAFVSAYQMTSDFIYRSKKRQQVRFAFGFSIAAGMFWSFGTGGRQAFGLVVLHAMAGFALSLGFNLKQIAGRALFRALRKTVVVTLSLVAALCIGGEVTGRMREEQQGSSRPSTFGDVPFLGLVSVFVDYMGGPIATYQAYGPAARRDLSETGSVSLAGLQEFGIAYLAGWRSPERLDTNPERAKPWLPLFSGTRCVFYDLVADFGVAGAMLAVTLLVLFSQTLFSLTTEPKMILPSAPLVMMLMFWGYSHQLSLLMYSSPKWLFISFGVWDLVHHCFHGRRQPLPAAIFWRPFRPGCPRPRGTALHSWKTAG